MVKKYKKEILRVGTWQHPSAPKGVLSVTKDLLNQLVDNFKITPFVPVLRGHVTNLEAEKNPALILNKNIEGLKVEGNKLYAEMNIDEKELEKYNDVSVSIEPDYIEKQSGKNVGAVLRHVAAVINPYIKGMEGFTMLSENDKNYLINLSEIQEMAKTIKPKEIEVKLEESTDVVEEIKETDVEEVKPEVSEESKEEVAEEAKTEEKPEEVVPEEVKPEEEVTEEVVEEVKPAEDSEKNEEVEASDEVAKQIQDLQLQLAEANLKLSKKDTEESYNMLLSEGRILPSQKETYITLHENLKANSIELADGQVMASELLVKLLKNNPVLVNLEEQGVNEVDAQVSEEDTIKEEIRNLPAHKGKTDEEFAEYWAKYKALAIEDYKKSKSN